MEGVTVNWRGKERKRLSAEEMEMLNAPRKERCDKGRAHARPTHGGKGVEQYNLAGLLECAYDSLQDAVRRNKVGATYQGILACCEKRIRKHHGKVFRWASETEEGGAR